MVALEFFIFHQGNRRGGLGLIQQFQEFFAGRRGGKSGHGMLQHHHPARRQEGRGVDGGVERLEIQAAAPIEAGDVHVRRGRVAQPGAQLVDVGGNGELVVAVQDEYRGSICHLWSISGEKYLPPGHVLARIL